MSDRRTCVGCKQPIPPGAKLAGRVLTRAQIAALCGESPGPAAWEEVNVDICLQCQVDLSRLKVN